MFNQESFGLRHLADAIERRDIVVKYLNEYGNQIADDVLAEWKAASGCEGFDVTRVLASKVLRDMWPVVASNMRERVENEVSEARAYLAACTAPNAG